MVNIKYGSEPEVSVQCAPLLTTIANYLEITIKPKQEDFKNGDVQKLRLKWNEVDSSLLNNVAWTENKLDSQVFKLLKSQGWRWEDVYQV